MLGHKTPENNHLLGIYSKGRYRQQHAEALQLVADRIEAIEKGHDGATALAGWDR
jgi:hypothetical protein